MESSTEFEYEAAWGYSAMQPSELRPEHEHGFSFHCDSLKIRPVSRIFPLPLIERAGNNHGPAGPESFVP